MSKYCLPESLPGETHMAKLVVGTDRSPIDQGETSLDHDSVLVVSFQLPSVRVGLPQSPV